MTQELRAARDEYDKAENERRKLGQELEEAKKETAEERMARIIATAFAMTKTPSSKPIKYPEPTRYGGKMEDFDAYEREVVAYLNHYEVGHTNNEALQLASAYLTGEAARWLNQCWVDGETRYWVHINDFMQALKTRFGDANEKHTNVDECAARPWTIVLFVEANMD